MLSPNLASILCHLCSLRRYWSFFVGTLDSCSRFLKHVTFLVETRQKIWDRNMILRLFLVNDGTFHRIIYRIIPCFYRISHRTFPNFLSHFSPGPGIHCIKPLVVFHIRQTWNIKLFLLYTLFYFLWLYFWILQISYRVELIHSGRVDIYRWLQKSWGKTKNTKHWILELYAWLGKGICLG